MSTSPASHPDRTCTSPAYDGMKMYLGDIHNHCGISYGHGTIEEAYANAKLQLDFASVTGHSSWHDMPRDQPEAADIVAYHDAGFARLADCWDHVQDVTESVHTPGSFVSLLSFEWHSSTFGDHCVYYNDARGPLLYADSITELHRRLRDLRDNGTDVMALPHHIGYAQGRRGINWSVFDPEFSPVIEIMSMHGCAESATAPRPYLHDMGPRLSDQTAIAGLRQGHRFGFIGSTDHHSAHPGSFGYGRIAAWASDLTREAIWDAIQARRVYAVTGDPITVGFDVDGTPMGCVFDTNDRRRISAEIHGTAPIDYVELTRDGVGVHRMSGTDLPTAGAFSGVVSLALGWGQPPTSVEWDVNVQIENGNLDEVVPRLRGADIVNRSKDAPSDFRFSDWFRDSDGGVSLRTTSRPNPNVVTDSTQGMALRISGDDQTVVAASINGVTVREHIGDLRRRSVGGSLGSIVSGAWTLGPAVDENRLRIDFEFDDDTRIDPGSWYSLRVRQHNDQWAWTSPIWAG